MKKKSKLQNRIFCQVIDCIISYTIHTGKKCHLTENLHYGNIVYTACVLPNIEETVLKCVQYQLLTHMYYLPYRKMCSINNLHMYYQPYRKLYNIKFKCVYILSTIKKTVVSTIYTCVLSAI